MDTLFVLFCNLHLNLKFEILSSLLKTHTHTHTHIWGAFSKVFYDWFLRFKGGGGIMYSLAIRFDEEKIRKSRTY